MTLVLAIIALWVGAALIWVAAHGTQATTPWGLYQQITDALGKA